MATTAAVRERPILFSGPMIRAILDGRKSQTRRVVKPQPGGLGPSHWYRHETEGWWTCGDNTGTTWRCPYGAPGDRLWVRETFGLGQQSYNHTAWITYRAGGERDANDRYTEVAAWQDRNPRCWYPSIHMPRWASRLTLEVTDVRVEQVQDITEADAIAEGVGTAGAANSTHRAEFMRLWDSLNAPRGFGWRENPWVWCVSFRPTTPEGES